MLIFLRFPLFCAVRCARWRYFVTLRGAVIISRRGAVFRDAVRAVRAVRYFVTRAVSAPCAVRAVHAVCAVRCFVTPKPIWIYWSKR